jgi:hypothetical protein
MCEESLEILKSSRCIDNAIVGLQVGDSELASKLARARLQQLTSNESSTSSKGAPKTSTAYNNTESQHANNLHGELQGTKNIDVPFKEEIMNCAALYANSLPTKVV